MPPAPLLLPCRVCAVLVLDEPGGVDRHIDWHTQTETFLGKWDAEILRLAFQGDRDRQRDESHDDAPTAKLPPIGDTVRRRPPVPGAELTDRAAQLHALADDLQAWAAASGPDPDPRTATERVWECALHTGRLWFSEEEFAEHCRTEHPWADR